MKFQTEKNLSGWYLGFILRKGTGMIYIGPWLLSYYSKNFWDEMQKDHESFATWEKSHKTVKCEPCKGRGYFVVEVKQ